MYGQNNSFPNYLVSISQYLVHCAPYEFIHKIELNVVELLSLKIYLENYVDSLIPWNRVVRIGIIQPTNLAENFFLCIQFMWNGSLVIGEARNK